MIRRDIVRMDRRLARYETQTEFRLGVIRRKQDQIMVSVAELQATLDTSTALFSDFSSDVTAAMQAQAAAMTTLAEAMAAMQVTLDAALAAAANDPAQEAMIADLTAQLADMTAQNAAMSAGTDAVLASATALNTAIAAADVAVQPPATPPTP